MAGFQIEDDNVVDLGQQQTTQQKKDAAEETSAALQLLLTAVGALSKRVLIAISNLFTLMTVASAFWLWFKTPNPDTFQLVSLAMYAMFILAVNYIVRRG